MRIELNLARRWRFDLRTKPPTDIVVHTYNYTISGKESESIITRLYFDPRFVFFFRFEFEYDRQTVASSDRLLTIEIEGERERDTHIIWLMTRSRTHQGMYQIGARMCLTSPNADNGRWPVDNVCIIRFVYWPFPVWFCRLCVVV